MRKDGQIDGRSLRVIRNKPNRRDGEILCGTCRTWKIEDEFYNHKKYGKGTRCKLCDRIAKDKWLTDNPERAKESSRWKQIKNAHGLTKEQWMTMYNEQEGVCKICKMSQEDRGYAGRYLCVDHNHKSGEVRGLLCNGCNRGLGFFLDSPGLLREAANYLEGDIS